MTQREFFDWAEVQDARYEFDGVQPVAMTGGTLGHSLLAGNINRQLGNLLAGSGCRPLGPDAGVATVGDTVRYPDAVVTCSKFDDRGRLVPNPVVVFEVISPSSGRIDRVVKLREYAAVPTIRRYVIVESDAAAITVLSRDHGEEAFRVAGLAEDDTLSLPEIGIEIPVAAIYEGVAPVGTSEDPGSQVVDVVQMLPAFRPERLRASASMVDAINPPGVWPPFGAFSQVPRLCRPDLLIEIAAIAEIPRDRFRPPAEPRTAP